MPMESKENIGVYELITELCNKTASKCTQSKVSQKLLSAKMRSHAYEIILRKSKTEIPCCSGDPIKDLLSYHFSLQQYVKNVAEYKRSVDLKNVVNQIRSTDFGESKDCVYNTLKLLIGLRNSVKDDFSEQMFQNPFSFGILDEMLPKPNIEPFGSPQPYPYYPSFVFELPYSLKTHGAILDNQRSQSHTEYTVETFDSRSFLPDNYSQHGSLETKTFLSPMSLASMTSTCVSPYSETTLLNYPKLTAPRDLQIPSCQDCEPNVKVSLASASMEHDVREVYRPACDDSVDIWELAVQVDKDVPLDIWEVASRLPAINERQLIATSTRELGLWRRAYSGVSDLNVISEKQFIRHVMYLIIGVETNSFPFCQESNSFYMKENLVLEGISKERIVGYVSVLLAVGTYYRRLYNFAFNQTLEDHFHSKGLIYEAAREEVRKYLLKFRLVATEIYEVGSKISSEDVNCMPTLLQILYHVEPLKSEIETVAAIYKLTDTGACGADGRRALPSGAELMSYFFNEVSLVTHRRTAHTLFNSLLSVCKVYFKFIERFIFEGELEDRFEEFFIRKEAGLASARTKRYWDRGFQLALGGAVPRFLRALAPCILLCGKSLRLLKMCNPNDPLVVLISSDHPSVRCCGSFAQLAQQQRLLEVYRTRCRFVGGARASLQRLLLERDAERKACAERAALRHAQTMDKIIAERKRLAQLIVAEKQHSLRVLEAAIAEAKAARSEAKQRERRRCALAEEAERVAEEVDARLKDDERNKMMEYYSKLNMEVEKSKIHTEWKIKRLQLDQSRMQLLSTEERNLKREKLELEHQRNEAVMQMSIQSIDTKSDDGNYDDNDNDNNNGNYDNCARDNETNKTDLTSMMHFKGSPEKSNVVINKTKAESSSDVFSAICNVAKSIFGVSKTKEENVCDNDVIIDSQGNVVMRDTENNTNTTTFGTSNEVIGSNLNHAIDNQRYLEMRQEALKNRDKVMAHEFGEVDNDNNEIKNSACLMRFPSVDEENNEKDWSPYAEARRNKRKVLGAEFGLIKEEEKVVTKEPRTEAQKEALINKQKVLGVEYNLPVEIAVKKEALNVAQEEAVRNKSKILGSEYETGTKPVSKPNSVRKSSLTLNLKPYGDTCSGNFGITASTGALTPGDLFSGLDLETPTTADIPTEEAVTSDVFTPRSEASKDLESAKGKSDKSFLTSDGFNFSLIVDEGGEGIGDIQTDTPENSPSKTSDAYDGCDAADVRTRTSVFNILDGSYNLDNFDPFGVKDLQTFSKDYFTSKLNLTHSPFYTHPAIIMEEVKKRPCSNIFSHYDLQEDDKGATGSDNIATLTACLQRSVMLPLTYQLEVVNNSILTYFLVNLDMYEHLRSLKDYFFLMDGEFARSICHNLFAKLTKTVNPQELLNFATLHSILDKALGSSISHVAKFSENLSFSMAEPPLSLQHSSPDALQGLALSYAVRWPLNIILSQEALLRYARVFQFLIKMRRIGWVLSEHFEWLKLSAKLSRQHSRRLVRSPQYVAVQVFRHSMAALVRALDGYLATSCILSAWAELERELQRARTLDDLYECHVAYVKKVLFRCLLNNRSTPVMKLLNDIFTVILKFSRLLKSGEWQQQEPNGCFIHPSFVQLEELFHLFEKLAKYLHKVVTRLMECGYQRHLAELLTMINLNGYYDHNKPKEDTNVSVQST